MIFLKLKNLKIQGGKNAPISHPPCSSVIDPALLLDIRYLCILPQILTGFKQSFKVLFWVSSSFQVILLGFYISAACILLKGEKKKISMMTTSILNIFQFSKGEIWMFNIMLYLRPILYMNFLHIQRRKLRQKLGNKNLRRLFGHRNWTPARQFHVFFSIPQL